MRKAAFGIATWLALFAMSGSLLAQEASEESAAEAAPNVGTALEAPPADETDSAEETDRTERADQTGDDPSTDDAGTSGSELPEAHRPTLKLEIATDKESVRTGDLVHVAITAEVPDGDDVAVPEQELGPFEIFDRRHSSELLDDGKRRFRFELDLLALEPGAHELPAIALRVVTAGGVVATVHTEAQRIEVGSHLGNEPDAQPKPPTQPLPVLEEDYTLLWVLGGIATLFLVAFLGFLAHRWWSRRPAAAKPTPPPRPPWEVALEKLDAIKREKTSLLADGKQVELVDRVSDALREYLGARYDFNGLESTTDEVITRLLKVKLRGIRLEEVTALLADSDLVKFAKAVPDEAQCDRILEGAVRIVRATTPRPEATTELRPASDGAGARIVTRDGEVTLPISAQTIEEAEREIRTAVGQAFRDLASEPSFEGTLRVVLSPALAESPTTTDALRRLQGRLSRELETIPLSGGRRGRIVIEHLHERPLEVADEGRSAARTIIDDEGVRSEGGQLEPASASKPAPEPEPASASDAEPGPSSQPESPPASGSTPESELADATERPRAHTGPALWASPPSTAELEESPKENAARTGPLTPPRLEDAPKTNAPSFALERLRPSFATATESGVLVRWVTGIERPIVYLADDEALTTQTMTSLGLSRSDVHERALANLRRALPPGFAPGDEPAVLDDEGAALLVLPELVPEGEVWIAYPSPTEGVIVLREGAASTETELARLEQAHRQHSRSLFTRPVRVTRRGFSPVEWPSGEEVSP